MVRLQSTLTECPVACTIASITQPVGRVIAFGLSPTCDIPATSGSQRRPRRADLMLKPLLDVAHRGVPPRAHPKTKLTKDEYFHVPLRDDMASVHLLTCTECYIARGRLAANGHGHFSTGIFRSDAYTPMVFLQSLPVPSEKTYPPTFPKLLTRPLPAAPSLAMLARLACPSETGMERFFRSQKPVPWWSCD